MGIKNFNIEDEKPEIISDVEKPESSKDVIFRKRKIVVESSKLKFSYLIFGIQKACDEYGIDYEECLVLLYLYELSVFKQTIKVYGKTIRLRDYVLKGFVQEDYSYNKIKLYCLSKTGVSIVSMIYSTLCDDSKFVSENRNTDLGVNSKVKSVLSGYFSK